jgi:WD40 repeat protein
VDTSSWIAAERFGRYIDAINIIWTPDGRELLGISRDGRVFAWDAETGKVLRHRDGEARFVYLLGFVGEGPTLIAAMGEDEYGYEYLLGGWHLEARYRRFDVWRGGWPIEIYGEPVLSPDGQMFAAVEGDEAEAAIAIRRSRFGVLEQVLVATVFVTPAWSPDSRRLAAITPSDQIVIWYVATGDRLSTFDIGYHGSSSRLAWSPDGRLLVRSGGNRLLAWDATSGQPVDTGVTLSSTADSLEWSPDEMVLAIGGDDGTLLLWDPTGARHPPPKACGISLVAGWMLLATGGWDHLVRVWDAQTGNLVYDLPGQRGCAFAGVVGGWDAAGLSSYGGPCS